MEIPFTLVSYLKISICLLVMPFLGNFLTHRYVLFIIFKYKNWMRTNPTYYRVNVRLCKKKHLIGKTSFG